MKISTLALATVVCCASRFEVSPAASTYSGCFQCLQICQSTWNVFELNCAAAPSAQCTLIQCMYATECMKDCKNLSCDVSLAPRCNASEAINVNANTNTIVPLPKPSIFKTVTFDTSRTKSITSIKPSGTSYATLKATSNHSSATSTIIVKSLTNARASSFLSATYDGISNTAFYFSFSDVYLNITKTASNPTLSSMTATSIAYQTQVSLHTADKISVRKTLVDKITSTIDLTKSTYSFDSKSSIQSYGYVYTSTRDNSYNTSAYSKSTLTPDSSFTANDISKGSPGLGETISSFRTSTNKVDSYNNEMASTVPSLTTSASDLKSSPTAVSVSSIASSKLGFYSSATKSVDGQDLSSVEATSSIEDQITAETVAGPRTSSIIDATSANIEASSTLDQSMTESFSGQETYNGNEVTSTVDQIVTDIFGQDLSSVEATSSIEVQITAETVAGPRTSSIIDATSAYIEASSTLDQSMTESFSGQETYNGNEVTSTVDQIVTDIFGQDLSSVEATSSIEVQITAETVASPELSTQIDATSANIEASSTLDQSMTESFSGQETYNGNEVTSTVDQIVTDIFGQDLSSVEATSSIEVQITAETVASPELSTQIDATSANIEASSTLDQSMTESFSGQETYNGNEVTSTVDQIVTDIFGQDLSSVEATSSIEDQITAETVAISDVLTFEPTFTIDLVVTETFSEQDGTISSNNDYTSDRSLTFPTSVLEILTADSIADASVVSTESSYQSEQSFIQSSYYVFKTLRITLDPFTATTTTTSEETFASLSDDPLITVDIITVDPQTDSTDLPPVEPTDILTSLVGVDPSLNETTDSVIAITSYLVASKTDFSLETSSQPIPTQVVPVAIGLCEVGVFQAETLLVNPDPLERSQNVSIQIGGFLNTDTDKGAKIRVSLALGPLQIKYELDLCEAIKTVS